MPCVCDQYSYITDDWKTVLLQQTCNICKADACVVLVDPIPVYPNCSRIIIKILPANSWADDIRNVINIS